MKAVEELARQVGTARACQTLAVPRASYYRRRSAKSADESGRSRRQSPRALSRQERQQVEEERGRSHEEPSRDIDAALCRCKDMILRRD